MHDLIVYKLFYVLSANAHVTNLGVEIADKNEEVECYDFLQVNNNNNNTAGSNKSEVIDHIAIRRGTDEEVEQENGCDNNNKNISSQTKKAPVRFIDFLSVGDSS